LPESAWPRTGHYQMAVSHSFSRRFSLSSARDPIFHATLKIRANWKRLSTRYRSRLWSHGRENETSHNHSVNAAG
jgi:hypothetical protein